MTTVDAQVVELPALPDSREPQPEPSPGTPVDQQPESEVDTPVLPPLTAGSGVDTRDLARSTWGRSVAVGQPLTGAQLGEQFDRPEEWGWDRIGEVLSELEDPREFARDLWRASMAAGQPLTGRQLGEWCRRSERWGRDRIAEARPADGDAATAPARRRRAAQPASGTPNAAPVAAPAARPARHAADTTTPIPDVVVPVPHDAPAPQSTAVDVPTAGPVTAVDVPVPGGARLVAWAGFLFGTAISVAANVLYAWLPTLAGKAGPPGLAPQVGAAVWPIALVISVEVLSRVAWRPGWAWQLARYGGAGVVAIGAAVISYGHLRGVLTHWGYGTTGAAVGPLVVDGLMTISGFALLAMSHSGTRGNGTDSTDGKAAGR